MRDVITQRLPGCLAPLRGSARAYNPNERDLQLVKQKKDQRRLVKGGSLQPRSGAAARVRGRGGRLQCIRGQLCGRHLANILIISLSETMVSSRGLPSVVGAFPCASIIVITNSQGFCFRARIFPPSVPPHLLCGIPLETYLYLIRFPARCNLVISLPPKVSAQSLCNSSFYHPGALGSGGGSFGKGSFNII